MKKVHYRNIGYPKSGTNWLWAQLMKHPGVDGRFGVDYKEFQAKTLESYKQFYKDYIVSVNTDVFIFDCNKPEGHYTRPERIHEHTTHLSLSFRNPYEVLNSMYNMDKNRNMQPVRDSSEYTTLCNNTMVPTFADTKKIFDNWSNCKLPIKYMFYDDLCYNAEQYMHDVCEYIGIKKSCDLSMNYKFKTTINEQLVFEDTDTIKFINEGISIIEDNTKRDLSAWKMII
jgi:hypothetical protein